ncbi:MAG: sensor signal transduction histidine kinase [Frankiales bacterium]|nr:sensor signal transduction histidine kinase [Frankiales bacterium]
MVSAWIGLAIVSALGGLALGIVLTTRRSRYETPSRTVGTTGPSASAVLEALPVAVLVVDVAEEVLVGNRAARELGLVRDGVLVALPQLRRLVRDTRVHGRPYDAELESPLVRPGRPPAVYRARLAPVGDGTVAVLLEDVTDARRLEDVRRDFVANVSHELKTPAAALGLLSEALQDAADDPVAVRRFAVRTQRESARLGSLVQDLVALSRLEGAERQPEPALIRLDRAVAEAVDRVRTSAQARGISIVRSGDHGVQVHGSEAQLTTALGNLLENAVNYSPDGARVLIGARTVQELEGPVVEVNVVDEGIGIAEKDVERVFERFYRADPARSRATGGTGLGLAIVKHVANNHGGVVTVRSTEGYGSTFTLRLPAVPLTAPDTMENP